MADITVVEVQRYRPGGRPATEREVRQLLFPDASDVDVILTGSGKASLAMVLDFFRADGRLPSRSAPVLVPQWLGAQVYNTMFRTCFPEPTPGEDIRGVLVYHQYGYPQQMAPILAEARRHGWFVIEDCAHAIRSFHDGKRLGLLGDAAIFSFSKFLPSLTGGAVVTRNPRLAAHVRGMTSRPNNAIDAVCFWAKWLADRPRMFVSRQAASLGVSMSYGLYDAALPIFRRAAAVVGRELAAGSLDQRDAIRDRYLDDLGDLDSFPPVDHRSITPYVLPMLADLKRARRLAAALSALGVRAGVYHFDVHRNLLEPEFRPCVWLPVHPGVSEELRRTIVKTVRATLA